MLFTGREVRIGKNCALGPVAGSVWGKPDRSPANQNARFSVKPDREKIMSITYRFGRTLMKLCICGTYHIRPTFDLCRSHLSRNTSHFHGPDQCSRGKVFHGK